MESKTIRRVIATVTIETSFESLEAPHTNPSYDEIAVNQIQTWIEESLSEDEYIPLFIKHNGSELSGPKTIKANVKIVES